MINTLSIKVHKIYCFEGDRPLKAFVDIAISEAILIKGIKVILGKDGLFVSMPQEQGKDNRWYESVRCLSNEMRAQITELVLSAYHAKLN